MKFRSLVICLIGLAAFAGDLRAQERGAAAAEPRQLNSTEFIADRRYTPIGALSQIDYSGLAPFDEAVIDPWLDRFAFEPFELVLMQPRELDTTPITPATAPPNFWRNIRSDIDEARISAPQRRYFDLAHADVRDGFNIEIEVSGPAERPVIHIRFDPADLPADLDPLFYFEVDTADGFNSPNFWMYPPLYNTAAFADDEDLNQNGMLLSVIRSVSRSASARSPDLEFPFDPRLMVLPGWDALDADVLISHAAHAAGLYEDPSAYISDLYRYLQYGYPWGTAPSSRMPIDVFVSGTGSCSHINGLAGVYAEMAGLPARVVGGTNPVARTLRPGGNHGAMEIYLPESGWSYFDPFYDVFLPGISSAELGESPATDVELYSLPVDMPGIGQTVTLDEVFRYRSYLDPVGNRISNTPMTRIPDEDAFGVSWVRLSEHLDSTRDLSADRLDLHIRARVIFVEPGGQVRYYSDKENVVMPVAYTDWVEHTHTLDYRDTR
ncbi:transglutaminase-like domain-containing protein [Hyphobacterium sp.]|uniref:transglutaminase-like domain-containing protein n=1 Tax=Hyphobacterium sp. TaxID=2004662 RepID=UPI003BAD1163